MNRFIRSYCSDEDAVSFFAREDAFADVRSLTAATLWRVDWRRALDLAT
jgi:hypothetical protein